MRLAAAPRLLGPPRLRHGVWVAALALCVGVCWLAPGSASADLNWGSGLEAGLPADAGTNPGVSVRSVSCGSAGDCAAFGEYNDSSGHTQGLLLGETAGTWGAGLHAGLPADAGPDPQLFSESVSCPSAGNCAAVGEYRDSSAHFQGLLLSETASTWGTGVKAALPANAGTDPNVDLFSVSCPSAGNCAAVGPYVDSSGQHQGLLVSETAGTWATGVEATPPADAGANPNVVPGGVSCASVGNCSAVGQYTVGGQGLLLSETAGTWANGIKAPPPADASPSTVVFPGSVSCASVGDCAAVGSYLSSSGFQGLLLSETTGTWGTGIKATLPADAGANPIAMLNSVSCPSAGSCAAVGKYRDSSGHFQGLLVSETAGTWGTGLKATLPADAGTDPNVNLASVSCPSAENCAAVGRYRDSSGHFQGLLVSETASTWGTGIKAALPADAGTDPNVFLRSVSCDPTGNCAAVGEYNDSAGFGRGLLLNAAPPAPAAPISSPASGGNGPSGGGGGGGGPAPIPLVRLATVSTSGRVVIRARGSTFLVDPGITVTCPGGGDPCTADETVTSQVPASAAGAKTRRLVIGRARFTIPAGTARKLTFKLNHPGARALRKRHHLRATVTLASRVGQDQPTTTTKTITIKPPPGRRGRR